MSVVFVTMAVRQDAAPAGEAANLTVVLAANIATCHHFKVFDALLVSVTLHSQIQGHFLPKGTGLPNFRNKTRAHLVPDIIGLA